MTLPPEDAKRLASEIAARHLGAPENNGQMADDIDQLSSWAPMDLKATIDDVWNGNLRRPEPALLARTDGVPLLYRGKVHAFVGESETAKSLLAIKACVETIASGEKAMYVDFEDDKERPYCGCVPWVLTAPRSKSGSSTSNRRSRWVTRRSA